MELCSRVWCPSSSNAPRASSQRGDDIGPQRLFGAVADLLERVGAVSPVVIVLDDLHWADRATTELLQFLVALDRAIRVMFVATLRDSEIDSKHALSGVLAAFVRLPAVYRAPLTGLDDEELLELVNVTARSPDARSERRARATRSCTRPTGIPSSRSRSFATGTTRARSGRTSSSACSRGADRRA